MKSTEKKTNKVVWRFTINGTQKNWLKEKWGLRFNPFPQHGEAELNAPDMAMQSLAEENMNPEEIRNRLHGHFTEEFIDEVVARFVQGEEVRCIVTCEW